MPPDRRLRRVGIATRLVVAGSAIAVLTAVCFYWHQVHQDHWYRQGLTAIVARDEAGLSQALSHLPVDSPRTELIAAALDLMRHMPHTALRRLRLARDNADTSLQAKFLIGEALCHTQEYHRAIQVLTDALQESPDHVDGHRWLAIATFELGTIGEAVAQLKIVCRLDPRDPRAHRTLGLIYRDSEDFPQAIDAYQMSLSLSRTQPDHQQILQELAGAQLRIHRYEDMLATLAEAEPTSTVDGLRAEALYALGRTAEAIALTAPARHAQPSANALVVRGLLKLGENHCDEAIAAFREALRLDPVNFETRAKLSRAYAQAGDLESARLELREFERIKAKRHEIHELTLQAASEAQSTETRYRLGNLYRELDHESTAIRWFRAVLAIDPNHRGAREALQDLNSTSIQN